MRLSRPTADAEPARKRSLDATPPSTGRDPVRSSAGHQPSDLAAHRWAQGNSQPGRLQPVDLEHAGHAKAGTTRSTWSSEFEPFISAVLHIGSAIASCLYLNPERRLASMSQSYRGREILVRSHRCEVRTRFSDLTQPRPSAPSLQTKRTDLHEKYDHPRYVIAYRVALSPTTGITRTPWLLGLTVT
jgi:hypothetical protein